MDDYHIHISIDQSVVKENYTLVGKLPVHDLSCAVLLSNLSATCPDTYLYLSSDCLSSEEGRLPAAIVIGNKYVRNIVWEGSFLMKGKSNLFRQWYTIGWYLHTLWRLSKIKFHLDLTGQEIELCIYVKESVFSPIEDPDDDLGVNLKKYSGLKDNTKCLLQCFFDLKDDCIQYCLTVKKKKKSIEELYHYIQEHCKLHGKNLDPSILTKYQSTNLRPTLRQYQAEAIHWMVCKERFDNSNANEKGIHPLWQELCLQNGDIVYLNVYSGKLSREVPAPGWFPKGGILADEMGLGKTVEVLALHFSNPRSNVYKIAEVDMKKKLKRSMNNFNNDDCTPLKLMKLSSALVEAETTASDTVTNIIKDVSDTLENLIKSVLEKEGSGKSVKTKRRSSAGDDYLTNIVTHGDYRLYKDRHSNPTCCCICSLDVDKSQKIQCSQCPNIFHLHCSGYGKITLADYDCPHCSMKEPVESHCTLIVCPDTLQKQWHDEIKMHVKNDSIKFMVYQGVKIHQYLPPKILAEYDIIITSFNTLRQDFNYVKADDACRRLRHRKRYAVLPCPLLGIKFWRMAIDEAQMVEADNTKLAEMCLRIAAVHRWCVTGTPFKRGMEDIYGLLLFLGVKPYDNKIWWHRALLDYHQHKNSDPLFNTLTHLVWRSAKVDVINQIQIPKQTEYATWLHLSAIERHYYQREFDHQSKRKDDLMKTFPDKSVKISDLSKHALNSFLYPLLQLRQASIHPGVVTNGYINFEKKCISMDQVMAKLIESNTLECEDAHRKLICALNGLAGVYILKKEFNEAVTFYQEVLSLWKGADLKTDSLQKLHTIHNLVELHKQEGIPTSPSHGITWCELNKEKENLKKDYMLNVNSNICKSKVAFNEVTSDVKIIKKEVSEGGWWMEVLDRGCETSSYHDFHAKVLDELESVSGICQINMAKRSRTVAGMKLVVVEKLEMIDVYDINNFQMKTRAGVLKSLSKAKEEPSRELIASSTECCLRPVQESDAPKCLFCKLNKKISYYESCLHSSSIDYHSTDYTNTGFRGETQIDIFLKYMSNASQQFRMEEAVIKAGRNHLKYFEKLKKEFKCIRMLYIACHGRVQAIDELEMCVSRLRFPLPFEYDIEGKADVVHPYEIDRMRYSLISDRVSADEELKNKKGQLAYLQNLLKAQNGSSGENPEPCPICVNPLGSEWAVFTCGHSVCCHCMTILQGRQKRFGACFKQKVSIQCPMCRFKNDLNNISIVTTTSISTLKGTGPCGSAATPMHRGNAMHHGRNNDVNDARIKVKGNFSTKIEAVVRRVLWIQEKQPRAKTLVFSTWVNVLRVIGSALSLNGVDFKSVAGVQAKQFERLLDVFKESEVCNVLLLPLHSGSKGLNIIEASHVILTEPALDQSEELQAVGRVHRIGQDKETYVHRFYTKDTVEEKMFILFKPKQQVKKQTSADDAELTIGDVASLIQPQKHDRQLTPAEEEGEDEDGIEDFGDEVMY